MTPPSHDAAALPTPSALYYQAAPEAVRRQARVRLNLNAFSSGRIWLMDGASQDDRSILTNHAAQRLDGWVTAFETASGLIVRRLGFDLRRPPSIRRASTETLAIPSLRSARTLLQARADFSALGPAPLLHTITWQRGGTWLTLPANSVPEEAVRATAQDLDRLVFAWVSALTAQPVQDLALLRLELAVPAPTAHERSAAVRHTGLTLAFARAA